MQVEVGLFAAFRKGRFKTRVMDLPDGTALRGLLSELTIPEGEVSLPLINGRYSDLGEELSDGDVVSFFPAIGGG